MLDELKKEIMERFDGRFGRWRLDCKCSPGESHTCFSTDEIKSFLSQAIDRVYEKGQEETVKKARAAIEKSPLFFRSCPCIHDACNALKSLTE